MASEEDPRRCYTTVMYQEMVDDVARTKAYAQALQDVVKEGDVVADIGTGPFALLACQAARAGASRVLAIEVSAEVAESARKFLKASSDPCTSKVEVHQGASVSVVLPTGADLVVHELIGLISGSEGAAAILRDAFARHAKKPPQVATGPWTVPARCRSWLVPVELPTKKQLLVSGSPDGLREDPFREDRLVTAIENFPFASCGVAHPQVFENLDFVRMPSDPTVLTGTCTRRLKFVVGRSGIFGGFAIFITGEMTPHAVASSDKAEALGPSDYFSPEAPAPGVDFCSAWRDSHWGNLVFRLNLTSGESMHVERGDVIEVDATVDLTPFLPLYSFSAVLQQKRGETVESTEVLNGTLGQEKERGTAWQLT